MVTPPPIKPLNKTIGSNNTSTAPSSSSQQKTTTPSSATSSGSLKAQGVGSTTKPTINTAHTGNTNSSGGVSEKPLRPQLPPRNVPPSSSTITSSLPTANRIINKDLTPSPSLKSGGNVGVNTEMRRKVNFALDETTVANSTTTHVERKPPLLSSPTPKSTAPTGIADVAQDDVDEDAIEVREQRNDSDDDETPVVVAKTSQSSSLPPKTSSSSTIGDSSSTMQLFQH